MYVVLLAARILLAAIFFAAGAGKLADLAGTRRMLASFKVPAILTTPLAVTLSLAEVATSIALVLPSTVGIGAGAAAILLVLLSVVVAIGLRRNVQADCHCFGQFGSAPIGAKTLSRNAGFLLLALLVIWGRSRFPSANGVSLGDNSGSAIIISLAALGAFQLWLTLHVLRQNGRLLRRVEAIESGAANGSVGRVQAELAVGGPAPVVDFVSASGERVPLATLLKDRKPLLLLFFEAGCAPCIQLLPEVKEWITNHAEDFSLRLIRRGTVSTKALFGTSERDFRDHYLEADTAVVQVLRVSGAPAAIAIKADGTVGSVVAKGPREIRDLVRRLSLGQSALGPEPPPFRWPAVPLGAVALTNRVDRYRDLDPPLPT